MLQISAIATAISDLIMVGTKVIALFMEAKKNGWIKNGDSIRDAISKASTDAERMALAKSLFDHRPQ